MSPLAAIAIVLASILAMEGVAWWSHKYVMHGFGWGWHRDHHEPHGGFFEKNDLFAIVGAAISISFFAIGSPLVKNVMLIAAPTRAKRSFFSRRPSCGSW